SSPATATPRRTVCAPTDAAFIVSRTNSLRRWLMLFNLLTRLGRRTPARARRAPASFRPAVETLGERVMPSAATLVPPADVGVAAMVAQHTETLRVEGTFNVTDVHGSDLSATVDGYLYLGNGPGL